MPKQTRSLSLIEYSSIQAPKRNKNAMTSPLKIRELNLGSDEKEKCYHISTRNQSSSSSSQEHSLSIIEFFSKETTN